MPYTTGKLKGELTTTEIRRLVKAHNKLTDIKFPVGSKREDILKIIKDAGWDVDHKNKKLVKKSAKLPDKIDLPPPPIKPTKEEKLKKKKVKAEKKAQQRIKVSKDILKQKEALLKLKKIKKKVGKKEPPKKEESRKKGTWDSSWKEGIPLTDKRWEDLNKKWKINKSIKDSYKNLKSMPDKFRDIRYEIGKTNQNEPAIILFYDSLTDEKKNIWTYTATRNNRIIPLEPPKKEPPKKKSTTMGTQTEAPPPPKKEPPKKKTATMGTQTGEPKKKEKPFITEKTIDEMFIKQDEFSNKYNFKNIRGIILKSRIKSVKAQNKKELTDEMKFLADLIHVKIQKEYNDIQDKYHSIGLNKKSRAGEWELSRDGKKLHPTQQKTIMKRAIDLFKEYEKMRKSLLAEIGHGYKAQQIKGSSVWDLFSKFNKKEAQKKKEDLK